MGDDEVPEFPYYIPEHPEMPNLVSKSRYDERKKLVKKFVETTLTKYPARYSKQGDTIFSDMAKERMHHWGQITYDLIFQNQNNRFMEAVREKSKMDDIELEIKAMEENLELLNKEEKRKTFTKKAAKVMKKLSVKDIAAMSVWEG